MSDYSERVRQNLLPMSYERRDLARALREWEYLGNCYTVEGDDCPSCELCGHPDLRYQFEINNRLNGNALLIGSECIKRFEIGVIDVERGRLGKSAGARKVNADRNRLISEAKFRRVILALVALQARETEFDIESFIGYYRERGAFTPNQLALLLWKLGKHHIDFKRSDFKLTIRRDREKFQLIEMPKWKLDTIWPAMSPTQKKWCEAARARAAKD